MMLLHTLPVLLATLPVVLAVQPNENLRDKAAVTYPYCFGANLLTQNFSANAVEPFWWSVYNASGIDPSSEINYPKAINISDTPLYTIMFNRTDFEVDPDSGIERYTWVADLPAGNYFNAYLSDSSEPRLFSEVKMEGYYIRHSMSVTGNRTACNRNLFDTKAILPFDNASTGTFDTSAWPAEPITKSDAASVVPGKDTALKMGALAAAMVVGGGLLL